MSGLVYIHTQNELSHPGLFHHPSLLPSSLPPSFSIPSSPLLSLTFLLYHALALPLLFISPSLLPVSHHSLSHSLILLSPSLTPFHSSHLSLSLSIIALCIFHIATIRPQGVAFLYVSPSYHNNIPDIPFTLPSVFISTVKPKCVNVSLYSSILDLRLNVSCEVTAYNVTFLGGYFHTYVSTFSNYSTLCI